MLGFVEPISSSVSHKLQQQQQQQQQCERRGLTEKK